MSAPPDYDALHYICMDVRDGRMTVAQAQQALWDYATEGGYDANRLECAMLDVQDQYEGVVVFT